MTHSPHSHIFLPDPDHPPRKVIAAMSGGVDSCFAAWKVLQTDADVIGVHLYRGEFGALADGLQSIGCKERECAEKAAEWLDIPLQVVDVSGRFEKEVIRYFAKAYGKGLTPNPCVVCNPRIKIQVMEEIAREHGADSITTGHHARIKYDAGKQRYCLLQGTRKQKDQSYFLARLTPRQLKQLILPAGWYDKESIREELKKEGFINFDKAESQDICFVETAGYQKTVEKILQKETPPEGDIVDTEGRVLGRHPGIHHFTIGQRKGLGVSTPEPYYVVDIDPANNRIIVGPRERTYNDEALVRDLHWIAGPPGPDEQIQVKIRYRNGRTSCRLSFPKPDTAVVHFKKTQRAVTPGQFAVFYSHSEVLGSGVFVRLSERDDGLAGQKGVLP